jgi:hypothetical protein
MPPKRKGAALYKDAMSYYKAAYRAHIKESRNWTTGQITSTLAWMWTHASAEEQQVSRDLRANNAQTLPEINEASVPAEPKTKDDPAPVRGPTPVRDEAPVRDPSPNVEAGGADGGDGEVGNGEPPAKKARGNTTAFSHWPNPMTINDRLPQDGVSKDKEVLKQEWLAKKMLHPDKEAEERRWHGVHVLGEGAMGRVGLWVRVNATKTIDEVSPSQMLFLVLADRLTYSNSGLQSET